MPPLEMRDARPDDAEALLAIYRPVVEQTAISFELQCPEPKEFARRIETVLDSHCWLVGTIDGRIAGYAYATPHRPRGAYRYSVETSVYVHEDFRRQQVGRQLYAHLFERLPGLGFHHAYAGITLPNPGSVALHRAAGFAAIGVFPNVGRKFDNWHDVSWWYREVQDAGIAPAAG